jgi:hypothetical protein
MGTDDQDLPPQGTKRSYKKRGSGPKDPKYKDRRQVLRVLELTAVDTPKDLIAASTGMTNKEISNIIEEYSTAFSLLSDLPKLRQIKGELIEATLLTVLKSINNQELLDSSDLVALAKALREINVVHRLHEGKSTTNAAVQSTSFSGKSLAEVLEEE